MTTRDRGDRFILRRLHARYAVLGAVVIYGCSEAGSGRTGNRAERVGGVGETTVTSRPSFPSDSAAVATAITAFHAALAAGDSAAALALLDDDVVVLESGGIETREQYRSHHLPADIAFARALAAVRGPTRVRIEQDVAWAWSSSTSQGDYRGRAVNSAGAELVVLLRRPAGWRITAIHWSSRPRR
jgi:ketosteroid isomerase-like protein